eukprot:GEMP01127529.1.p1 GENE.GEMP01127529.1~~GEMP01127529.1.p1  ORF type:complete len:112 (+),score=1.08 GEMP01127529.1:109-444(+)
MIVHFPHEIIPFPHLSLINVESGEKMSPIFFADTCAVRFFGPPYFCSSGENENYPCGKEKNTLRLIIVLRSVACVFLLACRRSYLEARKKKSLMAFCFTRHVVDPKQLLFH